MISEDEVLELFHKKGRLNDSDLFKVFGSGEFRPILDKLLDKQKLFYNSIDDHFELQRSSPANFSKAIPLMERLFPNFPQYDPFSVSTIFGNAIPRAEQMPLQGMNSDVTMLLVHKFNYATISRIGNNYLELTDLGRTVQAAGGHARYLQQLEDKAAASAAVSKLEFEKLNLEVQDLRNAVFDYEETRSMTKKNTITSIAGVVIGLIALLTQLLCNK